MVEVEVSHPRPAVIRFVSTNCNIFIPQGYPHCQEVFLYSIKQTLQLLEQNIMQSKETP